MISRIAIATASALALGTAGFAQEATQDTQAEGAATETTKQEPTKSLAKIEPAEGISNETLSDEKVASFVQALAAVNTVAQHFVPRIEAEEDGEKRAELMAYANDSIVNSIEVIADITPAEFKAIDIAAQEDQELNDRIMAELKTAAAEGKAAQENAEDAGAAAEGAEGAAETEEETTE
ncbi:hypothetical protein FIU86_01845 [Roseovarius sp. THAF9]|uniref:DUF4168 domain-containing protein n=1 Tax=Roseovarius sp. THAF9 TaxID=2587847 RepID=UPI0012A9B88C|nr:DUF4168 domain-containing protein [Roseovarius sp. THAF9]QFT91565.1 hypothetical protein FIU86_01845 [Roseovarius sp. THAF9]